MLGDSKRGNKNTNNGETNMFEAGKYCFLCLEPFFRSWVKFYFLREAFSERTEEDRLLVNIFIESYTFLS